MRIYELEKSKILEVKGEVEYICEFNDLIFVRGKNLKEPFKPSKLPDEFLKRQQSELKAAKDEKCKELNAICDEKLKSFSSSALGEEYIYNMSLEDQLNLMGASSLGVDSFFRCKKANEEISHNEPHTAAQLKQVFLDGVKYKTQIIEICGALKSFVYSLENIDEIKAVRWEDYIKIKG